MTNFISPYIGHLRSFMKLTPQSPSGQWDQAGWYAKLWQYYHQNGLYDPQAALDNYLATWNESMKSLRTCGNRVVEFYVSKLEPGTLPDAMPIVAENESIIEPIQRVWLWSNLGQKKPVVIRMFALLGDIFIQSCVNETRTRVYQQYHSPEYVTSFEEDDRGNLSYIRLDIPNGKMTHIEIWDSDGYRVWESERGSGTEEKYLGTPDDSGTLAELGIDFLPFAHAKFRDVGQDRGVGCFAHALDKIDEANRMATRLNEMLFRYNKPLWVVSANAMDSTGRPIPAPLVPSSTTTVNDDTMLSLPGQATLQGLVPDIKYADALAILQDMIHELERDLPEMGYANLKEQANLSGRAVRFMMSDAIDKAEEARGNLEQAMIKADMHSLSLGLVNQIFAGIGTYAAGDYEHSFSPRQIMPLDDLDRAMALQQFTAGGIPLPSAMRMAGFTEDQITIALQEKSSESAQRATELGNAMSAFNQDQYA